MRRKKATGDNTIPAADFLMTLGDNGLNIMTVMFNKIYVVGQQE
jgi:hypothetical protein